MGLIEILIIILVIAWLIGALALPSVGGLIHILLVIVIVLVIVRIIQGRKVL